MHKTTWFIALVFAAGAALGSILVLVAEQIDRAADAAAQRQLDDDGTDYRGPVRDYRQRWVAPPAKTPPPGPGAN